MVLRPALLFFLFLPAPLFAQTVTLFDRIQNAIQTRDEKAYLALVTPDGEARNLEQEFIKDFFSFRYNKAVFKLAEQQSDRMLLHVFRQDEEESRFEAWLIHTINRNG